VRQILVDHARKRKAVKRGGDLPALSLDNTLDNTLDNAETEYLNLAATLADGQVDELLELDLALQGLEAMNERHARIVECRFFTGLTIEETAQAVGVWPATVSDLPPGPKQESAKDPGEPADNPPMRTAALHSPEVAR
jgi:DNA-directed RNA polymerase specialized sigma subunit